MDLSELEHLYSPSRWSKRYPLEDVIPNHIKFIEKVSYQNKQTIPCHLNIPYGTKDRQRYDIFGTDLSNDAPIFIFIHGGYWQCLDRQSSSYVVQPFYKNGIKSAIIGYTLCPETTVTKIMKEIQVALDSVLHYAKKHRSRGIYISGYSAGAQIIAHLFQNYLPFLSNDDRKLFKAAILCCGVYDLTPLVECPIINKPLKLDINAAKELSPMFHNVKSLDMSIFVAVGSNDSPAFIKQSEEYHAKLKTKGSDVRFKIMEGLDHFNIVENYSCDDYELVKYVLDMVGSSRKIIGRAG